ncbi:Uncharacterised protein [Providencia rettgeri]|nr:hypothetical protein [Providencia rettgeri]CAB5557795.1 Uncharacterised protein [Providencia rettgeri]CAC9128415.1 Uncharacterised protein [Providencia rettgeri]SPZ20903.1 Uncharacterised protein [Providencia rettgeri]
MSQSINGKEYEGEINKGMARISNIAPQSGAYE